MRYALIQTVTQPLESRSATPESASRADKLLTTVVVTLREAYTLLDIKVGSYAKWRTTVAAVAEPQADARGRADVGAETRVGLGADARELLDGTVAKQFVLHKGKCGYRRLYTGVHDAAAAAGLAAGLISQKTVRELMRRLSLKVEMRRTFKPGSMERTDLVDALVNLLLTGSGVDEAIGMPIDDSALSPEQ